MKAIFVLLLGLVFLALGCKKNPDTATGNDAKPQPAITDEDEGIADYSYLGISDEPVGEEEEEESEGDEEEEEEGSEGDEEEEEEEGYGEDEGDDEEW
jgi:hypothetical protein